MYLTLCSNPGYVDPPKAELVLGYSWVGGDQAVFDNDFTDTDGVVGSFNQKRDWDSQAQLPSKYTGKPLIGLTYFYTSAYPNHMKKVKQLLLYFWDGTAWILHTTLACAVPSLGGPSSQEFDLTSNPMPNPTGKVRVVGRDTWETTYGYRFVTECRFTALV